MKYEVNFRNKAGEIKTEIVALERDEIISVRTLTAFRGTNEAELMAISYASRRGHRSMPEGFEYFSATAVPEPREAGVTR
jgi:hypothetical protein